MRSNGLVGECVCHFLWCGMIFLDLSTIFKCQKLPVRTIVARLGSGRSERHRSVLRQCRVFCSLSGSSLVTDGSSPVPAYLMSMLLLFAVCQHVSSPGRENAI